MSALEKTRRWAAAGTASQDEWQLADSESAVVAENEAALAELHKLMGGLR
jgi:hypothetical protein